MMNGRDSSKHCALVKEAVHLALTSAVQRCTDAGKQPPPDLSLAMQLRLFRLLAEHCLQAGLELCMGGERRVLKGQCTQNWQRTARSGGKQGEARQNGARPGRRAGGQQTQTEGSVERGFLGVPSELRGGGKNQGGGALRRNKTWVLKWLGGEDGYPST